MGRSGGSGVKFFWWKRFSLGSYPADRHPKRLSLQPLQDASQLYAGAGRVLLDQDPVHQVSVLLMDLNGRLAHLLQLLVLLKQKDVSHTEG